MQHIAHSGRRKSKDTFQKLSKIIAPLYLILEMASEKYFRARKVFFRTMEFYSGQDCIVLAF